MTQEHTESVLKGKALRFQKMGGTQKTSGGVLLGAHFSIAGGLHKAVEKAWQYRCPVLQLFTKNASTWRERRLSAQEIEEFDRARREGSIDSVCSHAAYLINLASPDPVQYERSVQALVNELRRSSQLAIPYVVLHPGAHMGKGDDHGLRQVARGINAVFEQVPEAACHLLLETTAGQGTNLGYTFEQLAAIADRVEAKEKVDFCFDTCHVFAAGYDLRTKESYHRTMSAFDRVVGLDRLRVIHVNDAKRVLGSRVDRHEHIGQGAIGIDAFRFIMNDRRLGAIPKILETPKANGLDHDRLNLDCLLSLVKK